MKIITIALLLAFTACTKVDTIEPQPVLGTKVVASFGTDFVYKEGLIVKVTKIEDSRCPENVTCVWAGMARVFFTITDNGVSKDVSIDFESKNTPVNTTVELGVQKYNIEVADVLPYPKTATTEIKQSEYKVSLTVKKP